METGTLIVSLIASAGFLWLNWRALQTHQLSSQMKLTMAAAWAAMFAGLAFLLTSLGF